MFKNYVDFKNLEVRSSIVLTIALIMLLYYIDLYSYFNEFQSDIKSIISVIIGGLFGLLTLSIAIYSIYLTIFTKDVVDKINEIEKRDCMKELQWEFYFIAKSYGLQLLSYFLIYLLVASFVPIVNQCIFWLIAFFIIYLTIFNICYTIELPNYIFNLNKIKNQAEELINFEKNKDD
jgi:hypothetical protein